MSPFFALYKTKMKKIKQKLNKLIKKAKLKKSAYLKYYSKKINILSDNVYEMIKVGFFAREQARILILSCLVLFAVYSVIAEQQYYENLLTKRAVVIQKNPKEIERENLKKDLHSLVDGHPIATMIPYIAQKDRKTAAYMIGIAKKESNWGMRKPVLEGQDCYNYWGFRATSERMGSGGHTCFDNPKEAVDVVAKRIDQIMSRNDVQSAKNMIVWKCGSDCSVTGGQSAANKWIKDVDMYAKKVLN